MIDNKMQTYIPPHTQSHSKVKEKHGLYITETKLKSEKFLISRKGRKEKIIAQD